MEVATFWVGVASLVVALVALGIAGIAWRRSDRNTSAGTLIAIFEAFRQAWDRYLGAKTAAKRNHEFHELMNLFEIGCAIHQSQSVHSASKELLEDYMRDTLTIIGRNAGARKEIALMRNDENVFKFLKRFLLAMRRTGHPHVIEPLIDPSAPMLEPLPEVDVQTSVPAASVPSANPASNTLNSA